MNRYAFEAAREGNPEGVGERQKAIEAEAQRLSELNLEVEKVDAERAALQAELGKFTARRPDCRKRSIRSSSSRPGCSAS